MPAPWWHDENELVRRVRARIRSTADPAERRRLRQLLIIRAGRQRQRWTRLAQMTEAQLINAWATTSSRETLLDLRRHSDGRLVLVAIAEKSSPQEADSAIAELAARANAAQITVADYVARWERS